MAILQISRIQVRRGLQENLPQLASGEMGWSIDQRRLYIGNGAASEGAPTLGNTEILTEYSDIFSLSGIYTFKGEVAGYTVQTGGAGALKKVERSMQDKFDDFANIRDFGAVGNGDKNDVKAFNTAIEQLYKKSLLQTAPIVRRTIYVPAGIYKLSGDFIRLLPYVKLRGDGKNSTIIYQDDATQPCTISTADSEGRTGPDLNNFATNLVAPGFNEIHDLTILTKSQTKDAFIIDSAVDVFCNRVRFQGVATLPNTVGNLTAAVRIESSAYIAPTNLTFANCDFMTQTYGIYTNQLTNNLNVINSTFTELYRGLNLGQASTGPQCSSVKVSFSTFDMIGSYGIYASDSGNQQNGDVGVTHVVSSFNHYKDVGNGQGTTPVANAVYFGGKNSYSIGDMFDRAYNASIAPINLTGKASFATTPDGRIQLGKQVTVGGVDYALTDGTLANTLVGIVGFAGYPTTVEYTVLRGSEQRIGTMTIAPLGSTLTFSDDYVETDDVGTNLIPVINTGVVELYYTTTNVHKDAVLKVSSRTLTGDLAPAAMPITVPGAPTITGVN